ncbi:MAG: triose-phosphate isomerase [Spirochaetes bacterium]|nr:triose-phosphate isomerase [Spirochaetota bacterium]
MKRREIFAGNWKMYKTRETAKSLVKSLLQGAALTENREVVVFPPSPYAAEIASLCGGSVISVGMQNMYFQKEGAFTGEVAPAMVRDCGCKYILIGHSERRHVFGETDAEVNKKVKAAFEHSLVPMICVGELLEEREKAKTETVLEAQVKEAFNGIDAGRAGTAVVAYEPVWAIGTGKVATPEIAEEAHRYIRSVLEVLYGKPAADDIPILYGGSVKADNIAGLYAMENIDGVLVGGASLEADSFLKIINTR